MENRINTRMTQKHDIEANWTKASNFIPKAGEIIVYDPDENYNFSRIKVGDGVKYVNNLEFIMGGEINVSDIINNLTTDVSNKPLSAAQGVVLKGLIDTLDSDKLDASALTSAIDTALT